MEALAWGFGLIEGPCVDDEGALVFSDVPNGGVHRLRPDGTVEVVVPKRRGVGGIALHADGGVVVSGRNVCHVDEEGRTRVLLDPPPGVIGFNDLTTDADGRVYVGSLRSDPFASAGERRPGELYRIDRAAGVTELYGGVGLTNGLGFSPDGRRLYHADSAAAEVLAHEVTPGDGGARDRAVFARVDDGVPDGLAVDAEGGVWVAVYDGGCVLRYGPDGELADRLPVPALAVTSLCFGGGDLRDLYVVTADNTDAPERAGTIFRTRVDVAGLPVHPATA